MSGIFSASSDMQRLSRRAGLCLLLAFIIHFYAASAQLRHVSGNAGLYSLLADAFLAGQTHLPVEPDPKLLALRNPYQPARNWPYRLHDASLYNGKYYVYFGPVPAAVLLAPYRWLTGRHMSANFAVWLLAGTGTLALTGALAMLAGGMGIAHRRSMPMLYAVLGLGTFLPFLLSRPAFYEIAIAGGYCFTALGILFLLCAVRQGLRYRWLAVAGLCFGLAAGCRIPMGLMGVAVTGAFALWLRHRGGRAPLPSLLALCLPFGACLAALGWYNYVRFGSVFETGLTYQLTVVYVLKSHSFQPERALVNLYHYFLQPVPLRDHFPYVRLMPCCNYPMPLPWRPGIRLGYQEPTYGLLANAPFSLWIFGLPLLKKRFAKFGSHAAILTGILLGVSAIIALLAVFHTTIMRYSVDFAPWWMLLACIGYLAALKACSSLGHFWAGLAGATVAAYGIFINICMALVGYGGGLRWKQMLHYGLFG